MKRIMVSVAACVLLMGTIQWSQGVELLVSGNFEPPTGGTGEVPFWELQEFLTGTSEGADTASLGGGADIDLFLKAFAGGGPLRPAQGNFDNDNLPTGDVDGRDFLFWQRGLSPTPLSAGELGVWQANYGGSADPHFANARLIQSVPGVPGDTYTLIGSSKFEPFYSGFVDTLGDASPFGQIASPTTTQFRMEFRNSSGMLIDSEVLDLQAEWEGNDPDVYLQHSPLVGVAPAGTATVRIVAEALDMAWNGSTSQPTVGEKQSAFFNDLSLTRAGSPGEQLLQNGDLQAGIPDALDFWNQVETPVEKTSILRAGPQFGFANHTPNGTAGVWLSAFLGGSTVFPVPNTDPVDGVISQTVGAVEGATYTFSGWTKFEANYAGGVDTISASAPASALFKGMPSPTETEIKLEFLDNVGAVISSSVIDVREERQAACGGNANNTTCGPASDGWLQHTLQAVAPAGTVEARLVAQMIDGVFNIDPGQSAFFDDFSLDGPAPPALMNITVPEPSSLMILALGTLLVGCGRGRK